MKTIIISDTHLDENFDKNTYAYLKTIISQVDKVILLGDFFESYRISLKDFLNSEWKGLFPLLKSKRTIYIPGNHDYIGIHNTDVLIFCDEIYQEYSVTIGGNSFHFEHGHRLHKTIDQKYYIYLLPRLIKKILLRVNRYDTHFKKKAAYFKSFLNTHIVNVNNNKIKQTHSNNEIWLVCGHTHSPEIDKEYKFINTGFIKYGFASFLLIDEKGHIELVKESY